MVPMGDYRLGSTQGQGPAIVGMAGTDRRARFRSRVSAPETDAHPRLR